MSGLRLEERGLVVMWGEKVDSGVDWWSGLMPDDVRVVVARRSHIVGLVLAPELLERSMIHLEGVLS